MASKTEALDPNDVGMETLENTYCALTSFAGQGDDPETGVVRGPNITCGPEITEIQTQFYNVAEADEWGSTNTLPWLQ